MFAIYITDQCLVIFIEIYWHCFNIFSATFRRVKSTHLVAKFARLVLTDLVYTPKVRDWHTP